MAALNLKLIPTDVRNYLVEVQAQLKIKKGTNQYSLERTIYQIVREHQKDRQGQKDGKS